MRKEDGDEGSMLPEGEIMGDLRPKDYKYRGVLEANEIKMKAMKEKVRREYIGRVKLLLESKLNGGNVIKAMDGHISSCCLQIFWRNS